MHGPIGFQPYWLKRQGYAGDNLLQLIADRCFQRGIGICAITSQADEITSGSVQDRFFCLTEEARTIPREYDHELVGRNVLTVSKGANRVYIVNGQTVMAQEDGRKFDILVVGTNQVPNFKSILETLLTIRYSGNIAIAEHPYVETHRGMGEDKLEENLKGFHAIEGHNSQALFYSWLARVPKIGGFFSRAGRDANRKAKEFAEKHKVPYIATSDAHRIEDLGASYISLDKNEIDSAGENFVAVLREAIIGKRFTTTEKYVGLIGWLKWVSTFQRGINDKSRDNNEKFVLSADFK